MRLYLVQHGDAVPKDVDPDRPLSDQGRADIKRLTVWLSHQNVQVAQILHSGKNRAKETAGYSGHCLNLPIRFSKAKAWRPMTRPRLFFDS